MRQTACDLPEIRVKPLFLLGEKYLRFLQHYAPQLNIVLDNDRTLCHTFTLAIRFALPLVAVSVMSPRYALTSARMGVSRSNLTALSLCHDSVCN